MSERGSGQALPDTSSTGRIRDATCAGAAPVQPLAQVSSSSTPTVPTTRAATTNAEPADLNAGLIAAPFRDGVNPSGRPNVSDYVDEVKDLLVEAITHFYTYIYTVNAFPDVAEQRTFATKAWHVACAAREVPVPWAVSDRMLRAVRLYLVLYLCHC